VWDTKYRPQRFSDVLGQQGAIAVLKARLRNGSALDTSYLFCGGHGMGKTTLARIHGRAMLCERLNKDDPDPCNECENCLSILREEHQAFVERDAASQGTIDHVRKIVEDLPFAVMGAPKRIYIMDEAHRMSKDAQDVLLKPIEEKKMVAMFCTTEPSKVRGAIRSRCEEHTIRKVTREDILVWIKRVLDKEGVVHEDDAVLTVIDHSQGHVRDVLNRLEMISQSGSITLDVVREQLNLGLVSAYFEALLCLPTDLGRTLSLVDAICERVTAEEAASGFAEAAMNAFRISKNMVADFTFTDRELAKQVSELYRGREPQLASYFLRSRYLTRVGLVCEIAALHQSLVGGGAWSSVQPAPETQMAPMQVVVVAAPAQAVPVLASAPVEAVIAAAVSAPPTATVPSLEPPRAPLVAPVVPVRASNDLGYIPSSSPGVAAACELTGFDALARQEPTRAKSEPPPSSAQDLSHTDDRTPIAAEIWRGEFLRRAGAFRQVKRV
jgi:DNA polymerase III subunit gamma/tau